MKGKTRVLVAPLDWGLGHATRCIPIIRELIKKDCDVWLAGEGAQENLLRQEFPELPFLHLQGYRVRYARSATGLMRSMLIQAPGILRSIKRENKWLTEKIREHSFDAVISDNRYGLYHSSIPCIFLTHQLTIKTPWGKWAESLLQKRNYKLIDRFTECWVPDLPGAENLAGDLSHPAKKPRIPIHYAGILSRFNSENIPVKKDHLLIILSGPEPQRRILEEKIVAQIVHYNGTATIVRGLPGAAKLLPSTNMIRSYNHLPAEELNREFLQAEFVIGRCGYSSVMDIITLGKKSILIPTPGQTEQEYLAEYLDRRGMAYCAPQKDFSLVNALARAKELSYISDPMENRHNLDYLISNLISI